MPLSALILTDHSGHSTENSVYALGRTLAADARFGPVYAISRSDPRHADFFGGHVEAPLYGCRVGEKFEFDPTGNRYLMSEHRVDLARVGFIWLRLPPPANPGFFAALSQLSIPIINDPVGILATGSKGFLRQFEAFTPPTQLIQSEADLLAFTGRYATVLKPLRDYGGRGIIRIQDGVVEDEGRHATLPEWMEAHRQRLTNGRYLAMKYLKNVDQGDKRILVVNGQVLGASLRLPAAGEWLCNVARGGTSVISQPNAEELAMVAAISPILLGHGILIYGMDTLVGDDGRRVLSELNTNSIGGFPQAQAQTGRPVLQQTIDGIYAYLRGRLQ